MDVKEVKVYEFSFYVNGRPFNFNQPAANRDEALNTLLASLTMISEEIRSNLKPKAN